jgi:hypothetical protein
MKKLLTSLCVLALGAGLAAGCTERSDRVGGTDRPTTSPSASPSMSPRDTTRPTLPPPPASAPSATPSSPSTGSSDTGKPDATK